MLSAPTPRKSVFDLVRRLLGRGLRQSEVDALDTVLDAAGVTGNGAMPGATGLVVSARGIELIRQFEGCARVRRDGLVEAYPDPATGGAPWTIGWGATGPDIRKGTVWTRAQCDDRLATDIARHADEVRQAIGNAPTSQGQFDALVSFHFNTGAIRRATLTQRHRDGKFGAAAAEFPRWKFAGGKVMPGLVGRRAAEAARYRGDE